MVIVKNQLAQKVEVFELELHFVRYRIGESLDIHFVHLLALDRLLNRHILWIDLTKGGISKSVCLSVQPSILCGLGRIGLQLLALLFVHFIPILNQINVK